MRKRLIDILVIAIVSVLVSGCGQIRDSYENNADAGDQIKAIQQEVESDRDAYADAAKQAANSGATTPMAIDNCVTQDEANNKIVNAEFVRNSFDTKVASNIAITIDNKENSTVAAVDNNAMYEYTTVKDATGNIVELKFDKIKK